MAWLALRLASATGTVAWQRILEMTATSSFFQELSHEDIGRQFCRDALWGRPVGSPDEESVFGQNRRSDSSASGWDVAAQAARTQGLQSHGSVDESAGSDPCRRAATACGTDAESAAAGRWSDADSARHHGTGLFRADLNHGLGFDRRQLRPRLLVPQQFGLRPTAASGLGAGPSDAALPQTGRAQGRGQGQAPPQKPRESDVDPGNGSYGTEARCVNVLTDGRGEREFSSASVVTRESRL